MPVREAGAMSYPPHQPSQHPEDPWHPTGPVHAAHGGSGPSFPVVPPPSRRNNTPLIVGLVGGAVVLLVGCCIGLYMIGSQEQDPVSAPAVSSPAAVRETLTERVTPPVVAPTTKPVAPTGPVVETVTMPRLTGKNAAVADDELRRLGFTKIQYGSGDENDTVVLLLSNWTVTKQSSKAGSKVRTDTLIVLTCTKEN